MYYVYILKSAKDNEMCTGCIKDLRRRLELHNDGKVFATHLRRPLQVIFYEAYIDQKDAFARKKWLKTGWGRNQVKKVLRNYLKI